MTYIVMAYVVMAYIVTAYMGMAYIGMAYIGMASIACGYAHLYPHLHTTQDAWHKEQGNQNRTSTHGRALCLQDVHGAAQR